MLLHIIHSYPTGRYDLTEAFYGVLNDVSSHLGVPVIWTRAGGQGRLAEPSQWTLHDGQPLDHRNWEISGSWLRDFK